MSYFGINVQILTAIGKGPRSTLRILRAGLSVTEMAVTDAFTIHHYQQCNSNNNNNDSMYSGYMDL